MSFAVGIGSHAEGGLTARPQDSLTSQAARAQYWSSLDARHGLRENTFRKSLITSDEAPLPPNARYGLASSAPYRAFLPKSLVVPAAWLRTATGTRRRVSHWRC